MPSHSSENVETELEEAGERVVFRVNEGSFGHGCAPVYRSISMNGQRQELVSLVRVPVVANGRDRGGGASSECTPCVPCIMPAPVIYRGRAGV